MNLSIQLNYAVIHKFEKKQLESFVDEETIVYQTLFDESDVATVTLVEKINSLLGKKDNNVAWGTFKPKNKQGDFPPTVDLFMQDQADPALFDSVSRIAISELVKKAGSATFSTGGYYLFAQYSNAGSDLLLIANIKENDGLRLNKDSFRPEEVTGVDLSKVLQAARINLTRYALAPPVLSELDDGFDNDSVVSSDEKAEAEERTYLCFISKGRGSSASEYFVDALGCQHGVPARIATTKAIDAIPKYFDQFPALKGYKRQAKEDVIVYLRDRLEKKINAKVEEIYEAAKKAIPITDDLSIQLVEGLLDFLNDDKNQVPDEFSVHSKALDAKTRVKAAAKNKWDLFFEKRHLGKDASSAIYYNEADETILLSGLDPLTVKRIKRALKENEE